MQADGGTGRGRQGWLVTPSDCRRQGVDGGKGECCLLVKRRADVASINEVIWLRVKMEPRKRLRRRASFLGTLLHCYLCLSGPALRPTRGVADPSAVRNRERPGTCNRYTTPSRKGGFGEDSPFPQDPSQSHLETTLKWRTPLPPSPPPLLPVPTLDSPKSQLYFCHHNNLARPCVINCRTPGAGRTCTQ